MKYRHLTYTCVLLGVGLAGCSGADKQLVTEPASTSAGTTASPGNPPGTSSNGGGGTDAGAAGSGSGHGNPPAPQSCPSGGVQQTGNSGDTEADATPFDKVACGTLAVGDTYWWSFQLPESTTKFGISFSGHVHLQATIDGTTAMIEPGTVLPFDTKNPYDLRVTSTEGQAEPYVVVVSEQ